MPLLSSIPSFDADRYLVGVSGGRDSVALLHWLVSEKSGKTPIVCHFDHAMRGSASSEDAVFVRGLAVEYGLEFDSTVASTPLKNETMAREARYRFFSEAAARRSTRHLFLAHHADDQAETILMNLCRGSGPHGLTGMRTTSRRGDLSIHRPWLGVTRREIDAYIAAHGLAYREDPTNADPSVTARNRLRAELAVALNRDITPAILRAGKLIQADDEALADLLEEKWSTICLDGDQLSVAELHALPLALKRRAIHRWLREVCMIPDMGHAEVERTLTLLGDPKTAPAKVNLPCDHHARRRSGRLFVETRSVRRVGKTVVCEDV